MRDERLANAITARMAHPDMVRVYSSRVYNSSQMTVLLRSLRLLVTSRYHAGVLSLGAQVPQVGLTFPGLKSGSPLRQLVILQS